MKILIYIIGSIIGLCIINFFITLAVSLGYIGNQGDDIFQYDGFKMDSVMLRKEFDVLEKRSQLIIIKDTTDGYTPILLFKIKEDKNSSAYTNYSLAYFEAVDGQPVGHVLRMFLKGVNNKNNEDFGWFSFEKYNALKLYKKTIIKPLSEKYKHVK